MTKKGKIWIALGLILVLVIGGTSYFYFKYKYSSPEERATWIVDKLGSRLDLSEDQKIKVNKIKDDILIHREKYKGDRKEVISELIAQIESDKVDQDKLNKLLDDKLNKIKESKSFVVTKLAEFHAILTPDQRIKLVEKLKRIKDRNRRYYK